MRTGGAKNEYKSTVEKINKLKQNLMEQNCKLMQNHNPKKPKHLNIYFTSLTTYVINNGVFSEYVILFKFIVLFINPRMNKCGNF